MNGIVQVLHVEQNTCQIQQHVRIGRRDSERFAKALDGLFSVTLDTPEIADLIEQLHRSWIFFASLSQSSFKRVYVKLV